MQLRNNRHVEVATEYAKMIDNFDDLVDPRTLARHCLSPEPSSFVLWAIEIEEKSKCSFGSSREKFLSFFFFFLFLTSVSLLQ